MKAELHKIRPVVKVKEFIKAHFHTPEITDDDFIPLTVIHTLFWADRKRRLLSRLHLLIYHDCGCVTTKWKRSILICMNHFKERFKAYEQYE